MNKATGYRNQSYAVLIARVQIDGWPWEPYIKLWTVNEDGSSSRSFARYSEPDKDDKSPDTGANKPFSRPGGKSSDGKTGGTKGDKGQNNSW